MIARFLGVKIWELKYVAFRYRDEALEILEDRYKATVFLANKNKCSPEKIILPDY